MLPRLNMALFPAFWLHLLSCLGKTRLVYVQWASYFWTTFNPIEINRIDWGIDMETFQSNSVIIMIKADFWGICKCSCLHPKNRSMPHVSKVLVWTSLICQSPVCIAVDFHSISMLILKVFKWKSWQRHVKRVLAVTLSSLRVPGLSHASSCV